MAALTKLDYLKRYMDKPGTDSSKKKKKKVKKSSNIKIIDSSISFNELITNHTNDMDEDDAGEFDLKEEKPIVYAQDGATVLTEEYKQKEKQKKERWKSAIMEQKSDHSINDSKLRTPAMRHDSSDDDLSPIRKTHISYDSDEIPNHSRISQSNSDQDLSPVRKRRCSSDDDLSPIRTTQCSDDLHFKSDGSTSKRTESKPEVLSSGNAGLKTGAELREENERKRKREQDLLKNLNTDVSGRGADTVR